MLPLVVTVTGPEPTQERTFAFEVSPIFVGRGEYNELQLLEPWIARTEGVLEFSDDNIVYARQSMRNRVVADGCEVASPGAVSIRNELIIGALRISFDRRAHPAISSPEPVVTDARVVVAPTQALDISSLTSDRLQGDIKVASPEDTSHRGSTSRPADMRESRPNAGDRRSPPAVLPELSPREPAKPPEPSHQARDVDGLHAAYRKHWGQLYAELARKLEACPAQDRGALSRDLQRRYPQLAREPEFRALLDRHGLKPRRPADPLLEAWLKEMGQALPLGMKLESGFEMDRLVAIIEAYTNAFVDLNEAQQEVRKRTLGRLPHNSILRSADDPKVVLGYLLDPTATWEARFAELRNAVRAMVRHDWALMQATLEGARELLQSLSPEQLAEREGIELPRLDEKEAKGFWPSRSPRSPFERLWRRFSEEYAALVQGDHYQRRFLGTRFARRYTRAMGQDSQSAPTAQQR